jgi:Ran GTPase-activating protein (RanGAP) involved in mRNA processing and transport
MRDKVARSNLLAPADAPVHVRLPHSFTYAMEPKDRPQLTALDLSCNRLGLLSGQALGDLLKDERCRLLELRLGKSGMGDEGAVRVVDALSPPEFGQPAAANKKALSTRRLSTARTFLKVAERGRATGRAQPKMERAQVEVEDEAMSAQRVLFNTSLTSLDVSNNGLGELTLHRLKHCVRDNRVLVRLDMSGTQQPGEMEGGAALEEFMELLRYSAIYPHELLSLDVSDCGMSDEACDNLARMLSGEGCRLQALKLAHNALTSAGAEAVADALKSRLLLPTITGGHLLHLDLSGNPIGSPGAKLLAEAFLCEGLPYGRRAEEVFAHGIVRIHTLELSGCFIGPKGVSEAREHCKAEGGDQAGLVM